MDVYSVDAVEMQEYVNNAYASIIRGLHKEKYLTKAEADHLFGHYSVMVETTKWLPKSISKWLGLKEDNLSFRLVKAIGREANETGEKHGCN